MMITSEGPEGPAIELVARFRAPRNKVFRAWTEAELLRKWFFAEEGFVAREVAVDLQTLGAYSIVIEPPDGGAPTRISGHYLDIVPDQALTYTWTGACADEQYWTLVRVRFDEDAEGSSLRLTHGVFQSDRDRAMHEQGWLSCLACLDRFLSE
jgi:uncharacterized protein YndB with AHSA1/START domain